MRKRRILEAGASYHVIARINRREMIFTDDQVKAKLLQVVRKAKKKYHFLIRNFCIMDNHCHFILEPQGDENLSKIMQWILSVFAIWFNKRSGLIGHVWYDRFKSKIIRSYRQYLATFLYISNNPVMAAIVKRATDYKYSGISFMQKGCFDILERPPNGFLEKILLVLNMGTEDA